MKKDVNENNILPKVVFEEDGGLVHSVNLGNDNESEEDDSSMVGDGRSRGGVRDRSGDTAPIIYSEEESVTLVRT